MSGYVQTIFGLIIAATQISAFQLSIHSKYPAESLLGSKQCMYSIHRTCKQISDLRGQTSCTRALFRCNMATKISNDNSYVVKLDFHDLKLSPLRTFLKFWMIGQDGWQFDENADSGSISLLHRQSSTGGCGVSFQFALEEATARGSLIVKRLGEATLAYLLQEALLLHRLLDTLEDLDGDSEIPKDRRLFAMADSAALRDARRRLPARPN